MLTNDGILHIKRYLAGSVGKIGESLALGVGSKVEAATDTTLDFEVARADITLTSYDFVNNRLVFKATLPEEFIGTIYEVGVWSADVNSASGAYGSRVIASFESDEEDWTGSFANSATRVGAESLVHSLGASATAISTLTGIDLDLSGYSSADQLLLAYNVSSANVSSIKIRFLTDNSNYYDFTISTPGAGYKITRLNKSDAVVTGVPDWETISSIQITSTSTAGGSATISFDGLRIEDTDTVNPDYVLVARRVLGTPYVKTDIMPQDIEFSLTVNIA